MGGDEGSFGDRDPAHPPFEEGEVVLAEMVDHRGAIEEHPEAERAGAQGEVEVLPLPWGSP
jgi:hypothetical protein